MPIKTTEDFPIKSEYYYLINFRNYHRIKVCPVFFVNKRAAKRALIKNVPMLKHRKLHYAIIKGSKLKSTKLEYIWAKKFVCNKYYYPKDCISDQQKKSYRTLMRRRLRRMGILTLNKPRRRVDAKPMYVKLIKNTQEVANSPFTISKVFQLERKPQKTFYYIIKKIPTKIRGVLLKVICWRIDLRTSGVKKIKLNVHRNDIIIPLLVTELSKKIDHAKNGNTIHKRCKKRGIRFSW